MKKLLTLLLLSGMSLASLAQTSLNEFLDKTDALLKAHVREGLVDYPALVKNPSKLEALTRYIAQAKPQDWNAAEQKAFFINAYNVTVMKGIVDNYPTQSPQAIGGFFESKKYPIAGEKLTLNELEKEKLLKPTQDARLHFVLVCAALGCPKIAPFAYRPDQLDAQLDEQTRLALNDPNFIRVDSEAGQAKISEIFTWYRSDFVSKEQDVRGFINQYRVEAIPDNFKIGSYTYDWMLNSVMGPQPGEQANFPNRQGSNIQVFTPSALFSKGQFEINFFNNLYTQTAVRDQSGDRQDLATRQSFINTMIQFTYGVSKSARVNVGFDLFLNSASIADADQGLLSHFGDVQQRKTVISYVAPRVKFVPFPKLFPRSSIQTSLQIPVSPNLENRDGLFLTHDRYTWLTQFFTDFNIGPKFQVFIEEAIFYRINRNSLNDRNFVRFFLSGFLSYFPTSKVTVFGFAQYAPRYETLDNGFDSQFGLSQWFTQIGAGAKYQINKNIGLELSYGNFIASRRDGAGDVLNFGIRFIK